MDPCLHYAKPWGWTMFQRILKSLFFVTLLVGCSTKEDSTLTAGRKNRIPVNGQTSTSLTQKSKNESLRGLKKAAFNLDWAPAALGNCAQLTQLSTGEIVADFAPAACPSSDGLLDGNSIVFSLEYKDLGSGQAALNLDGIKAGAVSYDWSMPFARLDDLCSGTLASACNLLSQNNKITQIQKR